MGRRKIHIHIDGLPIVPKTLVNHKLVEIVISLKNELVYLKIGGPSFVAKFLLFPAA